jgi:hypothetical protein
MLTRVSTMCFHLFILLMFILYLPWIKRLWISKLDVKFNVNNLNSKHYSYNSKLISMSLKCEFRILWFFYVHEAKLDMWSNQRTWMFWIKKDNSLGSNNLHLLDDSSIDYKHAQELLDRITWPNIYIFNIFYFLVMETASLLLQIY